MSLLTSECQIVENHGRNLIWSCECLLNVALAHLSEKTQEAQKPIKLFWGPFARLVWDLVGPEGSAMLLVGGED